MVLKLTPELISMVIGSSTEKGNPALFDMETYELYRADESIPPAVPREMLIEFPKVREVDVQRAYVDSLNDRIISSKFKHLTDEEFWGEFWNTFDDCSLRLDRYRTFEKTFYVQSVVKWCQDNGIAFFIPNEKR